MLIRKMALTPKALPQLLAKAAEVREACAREVHSWQINHTLVVK